MGDGAPVYGPPPEVPHRPAELLPLEDAEDDQQAAQGAAAAAGQPPPVPARPPGGLAVAGSISGSPTPASRGGLQDNMLGDNVMHYVMSEDGNFYTLRLPKSQRPVPQHVAAALQQQLVD